MSVSSDTEDVPRHRRRERTELAHDVCEVCGNAYDKSFGVVMNGTTHTFDSFECAIEKLAPRCAHCSCRIIGHGTEHEDVIYCGAHCAKAAGVTAMRDRA